MFHSQINQKNGIAKQTIAERKHNKAQINVWITKITAATARCSSTGNNRHQLLCSLSSRHVPRRLIHFLIPNKINKGQSSLELGRIAANMGFRYPKSRLPMGTGTTV